MLESRLCDTCITSPPYYGLRNYGNENQIGLEESPKDYIKKIVDVFREVRRVLCGTGTLWVVMGDTYAGLGKRGGGDPQSSFRNLGGGGYPEKQMPAGMKNKDLMGIPWMLAFALRKDGWYLRSDIIWSKGNAMPESVKDRPTRSHEYIFLLSKSEKYHYDYHSIMEDMITTDRTSPRGNRGVVGTKNSGIRKQDGHGRRYKGFNERYFQNSSIKTLKNKRSVWSVNTTPLKDAHFATFPMELIRPCVLAGCRSDGIVIDPFMGSGTTGIVALQEQRGFIGIELNQDYMEIARRRISGILET